MSMSASQVSVANTATSIIASNTDRRSITFTNLSGVTIYIGGDGSVTTSNGYPIGAGETFIDNMYNGAWFGIVASGTATMNIIVEDY